MENERLQQFNERLSQWVSDQGFWFQLRHSLGGSGTKGGIAFHAMRLLFRVVVFALIVAAGGTVYLLKRTDGAKFRAATQESLQSALGAGELAMRGTKRSQGKLEISRVAGAGGDDTFFDYIDIRNLRADMGLLDGLVGVWDLGPVNIDRVEAQIRAGADTPELAAGIGRVFHKSPDVKFNSFEIRDATINWGYSERTRGGITGSRIQGSRVGDSWRLTLQGGKFTQNWLRDLDIQEIIAICDSSGILFEKASFRRGGGTVDFSGLKVHPGDRPAIEGVAKLRGIGLEHILPPSARNFIEGRITTDLNVGGSTNSLEGVTFEGRISLDGDDNVTLLDRILVLRALSVVDMHNNYRKVAFTEGGFRMRTGSGSIWVSEANMTADELMTLSGEFVARPPTDEERDAMLARGAGGGRGLSPVFANQDDDETLLLDADELERRFTLRRAADAARRQREGETADAESQLFDQLGMNFEARMMETQAAERMARTLIYEGAIQLTLLPNAFELAEALRRQHPVDTSTRRIPLRVPLQGVIYDLTLRQAETIYEQGKR